MVKNIFEDVFSTKDEELEEKELKEIKGEPVIEYRLTYDSFSEGLEPVYFWLLDFMQEGEGKGPIGLGFEVEKHDEEFEASVGSAFFGDIGSRASVMQDRAMKMLQALNTVLRSIINITYDLKEFEIRLKMYDDLNSENETEKENAELGLKQIWLDQVDMKRGRGSVHQMTQQLQFVTLRDAFLAAESEEIVKDMDLNDRVKRILGPRLKEYFAWRDSSERELRKRFEIERQYLGSQIASFKLYLGWTRPYLRAAQKLQMKEFNSPNIISIFNNLEFQVSIFGKRKISPEPFKVDTKIYEALEVEFKFRAVPHTVRQAQTGPQYTQGGRINVIFRGYVLDERDIKKLKEQEKIKDEKLVEDVLGMNLDALEEDIKKYVFNEQGFKEEAPYLKELLKTKEVKENEDLKKKIKKKIKELEEDKSEDAPSSNPFVALIDAAKELGHPFKGLKKNIKEVFPSREEYQIEQVKKKARENIPKIAFVVYDVYKKAHGMLSW